MKIYLLIKAWDGDDKIEKLFISKKSAELALKKCEEELREKRGEIEEEDYYEEVSYFIVTRETEPEYEYKYLNVIPDWKEAA